MRIALSSALLLLAYLASPVSAAPFWQRDTVVLELPSGELEVEVVPERARPLRFEESGADRYVFTGDTEELVGKGYSIVLTNRTNENLKVVVAVDGVNVYGKRPIRGRADDDVGSVLRPRARRTLEGFQVDRQTAQRFVFSPPEWSEGQVRPGDREIGTIEVQIYREWTRETWTRREGESATRDRRSTQPRSQSPPIGTTAGEDIDSEVRRVQFVARTQTPEARGVLIYGRPQESVGSPLLLGLRGVDDRDGIRVVGVDARSLADEVGLRREDRITKVDTEARPSLDDLRRALAGKRPGDYLFLEVARGLHRLSIRLRLDRR